MNKSTQDVMFSSSSGEHETPQDLFDQLDEEFHFTLDPCATPGNAKCDTYFTVATNGLAQSWKDHVVWVNPPYGKGVIDWIQKAKTAFIYDNATVVMLLPARTDTQWFNRVVASTTEMRFIIGRLKFVGAPTSASFPSMLAIFRPKIAGPYDWHTWRIR